MNTEIPEEVMTNERAMNQQARRVAKRVGLKARISRWRKHSIDNLGGFQLIDPRKNFVVYGSRFELSAQDVLNICADLPLAWPPPQTKTYL